MADDKKYFVRGAITSQDGTSYQNLKQATSYELRPDNFELKQVIHPTLLLGVHYVSTTVNDITAISAKRDSSGNNRLMVQPVGETLTAGSPQAVSVGVTTTALVATNSLRRHLAIVNTSSAYVSLGFGVAAVLYSGITLAPYGSYEMSESQGNLFTGAVNAIASAGASNVGYQEDT